MAPAFLDTEDEEEVIIKLIEDNEKQEKQLADSLEQVINNLSEIVDNATSTTPSDDDITTTRVADQDNVSETTETIDEKVNVDTSTTEMQIDDLISDVNEPEDAVNEAIVKDFIAQQTLEQLKAANLTEKDMSILTALLELEILKGEQKDTRTEIENKLLELELLLNSNSTSIKDLVTRKTTDIDSASEGRIPRKGKTISEFETIANTTAQTVNLFENIQKQLFSLLAERHKFLRLVSQKINSELAVIQQTVAFLQQLINLKFDQGTHFI